jgi:hypothetical protein
MVERGQPVSFTVSGTKTNGEGNGVCLSVVMVLLSKEHHTKKRIVAVNFQVFCA